MRRVVAGLLASAVLTLILPLSVSATGTEHIKDRFNSIGWGGSDGSLPWSGPWAEINDDGDEKKGNVRVVSAANCQSGNCMWIGALTTLLGSIGAVRSADTSGFTDLFLRFDVCATQSLLASELLVQVKAGGGWTTVADYQLGGELDDSPTIDISDFRSENFQIRFLFSGLLLSSEAYVDNVQIYGSTGETTTTTTAPTTTTTTRPTTTTTAPTTTTTQPAVTSTTTPVATSTTVDDRRGKGADTTTTSTSSTSPTTPGSAGSSSTSTTSTSTTTTTTADPAGPAGQDGSGGGGPTSGSGLRLAARGLQANFQGDVYGEVRAVTHLNGVDFRADYNMAVEIIEASWGWIVVLALVVSYSILSGLDRRRRRADI